MKLPFCQDNLQQEDVWVEFYTKIKLYIKNL